MLSIFKYRFVGFLLVALAVQITACDSNSSGPSMQELLAAPEQVEISGQNYTLATYLWRDFMPGTYGQEGSDLMAVVTISETALQAIPSDITATYLWIINGEEIWGASFSDESRPPAPAYQIEKIARGGPKWSPGTNVVVVVKMTNGAGNSYLLKAPNQSIQATY